MMTSRASQELTCETAMSGHRFKVTQHKSLGFLQNEEPYRAKSLKNVKLLQSVMSFEIKSSEG